jgi:hypothetical protein
MRAAAAATKGESENQLSSQTSQEQRLAPGSTTATSPTLARQEESRQTSPADRRNLHQAPTPNFATPAMDSNHRTAPSAPASYREGFTRASEMLVTPHDVNYLPGIEAQQAYQQPPAVYQNTSPGYPATQTFPWPQYCGASPPHAASPSTMHRPVSAGGDHQDMPPQQAYDYAAPLDDSTNRTSSSAASSLKRPSAETEPIDETAKRSKPSRNPYDKH